MSSIKVGNTELRHQHRFAGSKQVAFSEFIQGSNVLLSRGPLTGEDWRNGSSTSGMEMASVEDALSTVRQSDSAAILHDHAVCRERHDDLTRVALRGLPFSNRRIAFLRPRGACRCHVAVAFIDLARRIRYECFPHEPPRSS